jgi:hypothetical protein
MDLQGHLLPGRFSLSRQSPRLARLVVELAVGFGVEGEVELVFPAELTRLFRQPSPGRLACSQSISLASRRLDSKRALESALSHRKRLSGSRAGVWRRAGFIGRGAGGSNEEGSDT